MAATLRHRGPDDSGEWVDPSAGVALGFRRLSIIDPSPEGHQPMESASGRYVVAFNGEIYNFERIRGELRSASLQRAFRGHSDTEVLLAAVEAWGLSAALERFVGMFSLALWDLQTRRLHLVRDRMGIKPLYYGWTGSTLLFGSELKALRVHPNFSGTIDRRALALYIRMGYVPGPHSIYEGISKLRPGTVLTVPAEGGAPTSSTYWSPRPLAEAGVRDRFEGDEDAAVEKLDGLLRDAVGLRMIADVPLGVFLSGGIDSTTVVALMQDQSRRPVRTFTIGYEEDEYDESPHARRLAEHLGTEHTELRVGAEDAMSVIPSLPAIYDEPFADSSQIPTHLVSALARRDVTVSLSGDGGDELFGGYPRYLFTSGATSALTRLPRPLRRAVGYGLRSLPADLWDRIFGVLRPVLPGGLRRRHPGRKLLKLARVLEASSDAEVYERIASVWPGGGSAVLGSDGAEAEHFRLFRELGVPEFTERMMVTDLMTYLVDDILVKVDRASMAVGLEAREPLLDHRVAEFAFRLPLRMKLRDGKGKWILRRVLDRYVPSGLVDRPKAGFGLPIDRWLRGPLREWAEELLAEGRLRSDGYLDPGLIRRKWDRHLEGGSEHHALWSVLMFQAWLDSQEESPSSPPTPNVCKMQRMSSRNR